jgi:hypothetical protein
VSKEVPTLIPVGSGESMMLGVDAYGTWLVQDVWEYDFDAGRVEFRRCVRSLVDFALVQLEDFHGLSDVGVEVVKYKDGDEGHDRA